LGEGTITGATAVILAGGAGRRMGRDKALIELGGKPLAKYAAEGAAKVFGTVVISGPPSLSALGFSVVSDEYAGGGPLSGIHAALSASDTDWIFVMPCDSPFVPEAFMRGIAAEAKDCDVVVPRHGRFYEPLHAMYHKRCLPHVKRLLDEDEHKIVRLYEFVRVKELGPELFEEWDPELLAFFNINTPEDMKKAEMLAERAD